MADEKKTLGELVAALQAEFGEHQYGRIDMHIDEELKQSAIARARALGAGDTMAGLKVLRVETLDGIKFFLENPACAGRENAAETVAAAARLGNGAAAAGVLRELRGGVGRGDSGGGKTVCAGRARRVTSVETKGLLFDMDGVLIRSIGSVERCWQRWCKQYGVPNADDFKVQHGVRAQDIAGGLKPEWDEAQLAEGLRAIEDMEIEDTRMLRCCRVRRRCSSGCRRSAGR